MGRMVRDAPWRKLRGGGGFCDDNDAFARVYNNLLLHEYSALLTCSLPFFLYLSTNCRCTPTVHNFIGKRF